MLDPQKIPSGDVLTAVAFGLPLLALLTGLF
jgi:hypothetical protein